MSVTPQGDNIFNFDLACDQLVHLETAANLCVSRKAIFSQFFYFWELGNVKDILNSHKKVVIIAFFVNLFVFYFPFVLPQLLKVGPQNGNGV